MRFLKSKFLWFSTISPWLGLAQCVHIKWNLCKTIAWRTLKVWTLQVDVYTSSHNFFWVDLDVSNEFQQQSFVIVEGICEDSRHFLDMLKNDTRISLLVLRKGEFNWSKYQIIFQVIPYKILWEEKYMSCIDSVTCRAFTNTLLAKFHFIWAPWPKCEQKYVVNPSNCPVFVKEVIVSRDWFENEFFITEVFQRLSYQSGLFEKWLMDQKFFPHQS